MSPNQRVTLSAPRPSVAPGTLNQRTVSVNGTRVGTLYGTDASPNNPTRPTAFEFEPTTLAGPCPPQRYTHLAEARTALTHAYTGA